MLHKTCVWCHASNQILRFNSRDYIPRHESLLAEAAQKAREKRIAEEKEVDLEYLSEDEYDDLDDEAKRAYDTKVLLREVVASRNWILFIFYNEYATLEQYHEDYY